MAIIEEYSRSRRRLDEPSIDDRLSDLPDSLICHILSFLTTKFSVRTSVLGKRWRYLWAYVPDLVFFDENPEIVNSVLLLRKVQNINTFRLVYGIECSKYQLETWVTFSIVRNVQTLHLSARSQFDLPRCLFTCKTLVDLRLSSCGIIPKSGAVCLPRLKILCFKNIGFEADESLPHLLSGCPVLEVLGINFLKNMVYCDVSSPTLKRLILDFMSNGTRGRSDRLEINTPALEYLQIMPGFYGNIKSGVLTSLIEARISPDNEEIIYFRSMLDFLDKLCNVKYLQLNLSHCVEIINSVLSAWTTSFRNLTRLKLAADCRFLSMFLKNADMLEMLVFSEFCGEIEDGMEPQQVPKCLLSHLRFIKLGNIKGRRHELGYIGYLLRNAKVLERMDIVYAQSITPNEKINMLQNISFFERGSTACKIAFF